VSSLELAMPTTRRLKDISSLKNIQSIIQVQDTRLKESEYLCLCTFKGHKRIQRWIPARIVGQIVKTQKKQPTYVVESWGPRCCGKQCGGGSPLDPRCMVKFRGFKTLQSYRWVEVSKL